MRKKLYHNRKLNDRRQPYLKYNSILYLEALSDKKKLAIGKIIDEMIEKQEDYKDVVNKQIEGLKIK